MWWQCFCGGGGRGRGGSHIYTVCATPASPRCSRERRWRDCISDEHYVPSLLAMHGQDNQTDCRVNGGTAVDWSAGGLHPQTWWASDVREGECGYMHRTAHYRFLSPLAERFCRGPQAAL